MSKNCQHGLWMMPMIVCIETITQKFLQIFPDLIDECSLFPDWLLFQRVICSLTASSNISMT